MAILASKLVPSLTLCEDGRTSPQSSSLVLTGQEQGLPGLPREDVHELTYRICRLFPRHTHNISHTPLDDLVSYYVIPTSPSSLTMRRNSNTSSSCRIERKRAHDREAQRASRAKTKQYIAHLEKTIADLTEGSGDNHANYLAQHASQQSQEIDKLQGLVNKIRTLVQDTVKSEEDGLPGGNALSPSKTFSVMNWDAQSEDRCLMNDVTQPQSSNFKQAQEPRQAASSPRSLVVLGVDLYCEDSDEATYLLRLNELIEKLEKTPDNLSSLEEDQDILIRAITCGWDASERLHHFDIVWRFLRAFDEGLWHRAQPIERFAHFWNVRSTMLHKIQLKNQPRRKMGTFMSPAVGQRSSSYPAIIDYFGWPQVRKHLLTTGLKQCTDRGVLAFTKSFRFVWPWELRDAYKINKTTGMYSFSEAFLKSFNDISSFRLLANELVPFEVRPPSQTVPEPNFADADEEDTSADDEFTHPEPTFGAAAAVAASEGEQVMHTEPSAQDWMATLASLHEAGRHEIQSLHALSIPPETSLALWGNTREPVGFF